MTGSPVGLRGGVTGLTAVLLLLAAAPPLASARRSPGVRSDKAAASPVGTALQLQCPPCDRIHCSPRRARHLRCRGGVTRGICNCCPVCAKTEGEPCGGEYGYLGRCDGGLGCSPAPSPLQVASHNQPAGTCRSVAPVLLDDQGFLPSHCQPKCTPHFCQANRKSICAALDNADVTQGCQGPCQHTSCSACRYVTDEPDCVKCSKDDFRCMKRFAKCVRQTYCTRQKYPCKRTVESDDGARFKCLIPDCLTV